MNADPQRDPDPTDDEPDDWGAIREDPAEPRFKLGDLVSGPDPLPVQPPAAQAPSPGLGPGPGPDRGAATDLGFDAESEPFGHYRSVQRLGIIGGKGVGKSYLFQAMVYRVAHARTAGALSYFLDSRGVELVRTLSREEHARRVVLQRFNGDYERWTRLGSTLAARQPWYRLTLPYRTGLLGRTRAAMEVEFFDGSGEQFFEARDPQNRDLWMDAYRDARVMAFCLPLWAVFPAADLSAADWRERDGILESFHEVVQNYKDLRRHPAIPARTPRGRLERAWRGSAHRQAQQPLADARRC